MTTQDALKDTIRRIRPFSLLMMLAALAGCSGEEATAAPGASPAQIFELTVKIAGGGDGPAGADGHGTLTSMGLDRNGQSTTKNFNASSGLTLKWTVPAGWYDLDYGTEGGAGSGGPLRCNPQFEVVADTTIECQLRPS